MFAIVIGRAIYRASVSSYDANALTAVSAAEGEEGEEGYDSASARYDCDCGAGIRGGVVTYLVRGAAKGGGRITMGERKGNDAGCESCCDCVRI